MAKKKITQLVEELLSDFLEKEGYELYKKEKTGSSEFMLIRKLQESMWAPKTARR